MISFEYNYILGLTSVINTLSIVKSNLLKWYTFRFSLGDTIITKRTLKSPYSCKKGAFESCI